jgi:serine/threonine protein kinase
MIYKYLEKVKESGNFWFVKEAGGNDKLYAQALDAEKRLRTGQLESAMALRDVLDIFVSAMGFPPNPPLTDLSTRLHKARAGNEGVFAVGDAFAGENLKNLFLASGVRIAGPFYPDIFVKMIANAGHHHGGSMNFSVSRDGLGPSDLQVESDLLISERNIEISLKILHRWMFNKFGVKGDKVYPEYNSDYAPVDEYFIQGCGKHFRDEKMKRWGLTVCEGKTADGSGSARIYMYDKSLLGPDPDGGGIAENLAKLYHPVVGVRHRLAGNRLTIICEWKKEGAIHFGEDGAFLEDMVTSLDDAARTALKVAEAVRELHSGGLLHLDVEPANIFKDKKTGSFAVLTKYAPLGPGQPGGSAGAGLTGSESVRPEGPSFQAPELGSSDESALGAAADVFSVGALFLWLLARGENPRRHVGAFSGEGWLKSPGLESLGDFCEDLDADGQALVKTILVKTLSADPGGRYNDIGGLISDLERLRIVSKSLKNYQTFKSDLRFKVLALRMFGLSFEAIARLTGRDEGRLRSMVRADDPVIEALFVNNPENENTARENFEEDFYSIGFDSLFGWKFLRGAAASLPDGGARQLSASKTVSKSELFGQILSSKAATQAPDRGQDHFIALSMVLQLMKYMRTYRIKSDVDLARHLKTLFDFNAVIIKISLTGGFAFRDQHSSSSHIKWLYSDESFKEKMGRLPEGGEAQGGDAAEYALYTHKICEIAGWLRFFEGRDSGGDLWNGSIVRASDVAFERHEHSGEGMLAISACGGSYVSHLGTNIALLHGQTDQFLKPFLTAEGRRALTERLEGYEARYPEEFSNDFEDLASFLENWRPGEDFRKGLADFVKEAVKNEKKRPEALRGSLMANLISVNATYVTKDGYVVLQKRLNKSGREGHREFQTSAAGFLYTRGHYSSSDPPQIEDALFAETEEEMGLDHTKILSYKVTGIVRDTVNYEVGVTVFGTVDVNLNGVVFVGGGGDGESPPGAGPGGPGISQEGGVIGYPAAERYGTEVDGFVLLKFEPKIIFDFILSDCSGGEGAGGGQGRSPWSSFMPLGAASLILALATRHEWEELAEIWKKCRMASDELERAAGRPAEKEPEGGGGQEPKKEKRAERERRREKSHMFLSGRFGLTRGDFTKLGEVREWLGHKRDKGRQGGALLRLKGDYTAKAGWRMYKFVSREAGMLEENRTESAKKGDVVYLCAPDGAEGFKANLSVIAAPLGPGGGAPPTLAGRPKTKLPLRLLSKIRGVFGGG